MSGVAMLGMYDTPRMQPANDRFWSSIRAALGHGPAQLSRDGAYWEIWRASDLVLAQTCGLPYRSALHEHVQLIGTPDYALPGCPPGYYCSVILTRKTSAVHTLKDCDGQPMAVNEAGSQSGWAAAQPLLQDEGLLPSEVLYTGAHAASLEAVARSEADFASLDLHTWRLLQEDSPALCEAVQVIARTACTPGLPLISGPGQDLAQLRDAVHHALEAMPAEDRATLCLQGGAEALIQIPKADYLKQPLPPTPEELGLITRTRI